MNINKFQKNIILILVSITIILLVWYFVTQSNLEYEGYEGYERSKLKWNKNKCNYLMSQTLIDELKNNKIEYSETNWNLYMPCAYDETSKEIAMMPVVNGAKYFMLENCDEIVAKERLWKNVVEYYGQNIAKTMIPNSYVLYDESDVKRFEQEYNKNKIYIMKKNIQRQEGLKITSDLNEILNGYKNQGYVLVQELLQNPYIISGRKTNMRFYVLVIYKQNDMNVYVFNDGFMYYTKEMFKKNSLDIDPNITTGYIDRQVYIDNPLTHSDLKKYLDNENRNLLLSEKNIINQGKKISEVYFENIYNLINKIFVAHYHKLNNINGKRKFNHTNTTFQLFGVDIAVDENLIPTVMEVNKGPDLGAKDKRDSELKHNVVRDVLKIITKTNKYDGVKNGFIKVLEINEGQIKN